MRVLVQVSGTVDEADLWPYVSRVQPYRDGSLLDVEVLDGRELVSALVALLDRDLDIVKVETVGPAAQSAPDRTQ